MVDPENSHIVNGAHLRRVRQGHQGRVEQFLMIIGQKEDDPGPVLRIQLRKAEQAGSQSLSDRGRPLDLIAGRDSFIKGGHDAVELLIAGPFGFRYIVYGVVF